MTDLHAFFAFASDAEIAALWAAGFFAVAAVARIAESRRIKRARIDRVGWVPWTGIFLVCAVIGAALLALSAKGLVTG
ncbi:hypothetical protein EB810_14570 [Altererythrobacter sp. FM1]|uniref:Uncharacterized protein n=1 Tax=Tsuneonella flava TaxID=2055955 RepID=A0ABX7KC61_9SPHN|nr:hypothetical protein [Tsuneonella flava]QSB45879.1 hypothetical protein IDJ81_07325 [Tsuneonella flava]ROT93319.1 hypothetical protein EB810_14570 [Altererythrobacter sp. FM1]